MVTATETGPGIQDGIALTVTVLNGAAITVSGPTYQSSFTAGAAGSANAAAPAEVTLIPQGTGSLIYGAVNRINMASAWTPAAGTVFSQNVADTVNGASYGTFRSGTGTAPTLAASYPVYDISADAASLVTGSFTPSAGDILVVKVLTPGDTARPSGPPSGGGLAYTQQVWDDPSAWAYASIWTSSPVGSSPSAMTVTVPFTGSIEQHSMVVERWSGAQIATVPNTDDDRMTTAAATQISAQPSSAVSWCEVDYNAVDGSGRTYATTSATPAEDGYTYTAAVYTAYYATQMAAAGTIQNFGVTSPSVGVKDTALGIEILGVLSGGTTTAGTPVTVGATDGDGAGGAYGGVAAVEIPATGVLSQDLSTPSPVINFSDITVSTGRFCPPMGSLLVATVATAGGTGVSVTDDNGMLSWRELSRQASGMSGYAGVWGAVVVCG